MRGDLSLLLCGEESSRKDDIDEVLDYIADQIDAVLSEIGDLRGKDDKHVMLYGPFLGRSVLELGCTALIARIDPFRVLLLREKQKQPSFFLDKPHKSSIRWQGDVMAEAKVDNLWDDKSLQNPTRALLGDYYAHLLWNRTIDTVLDAIIGKTGTWFDKIRQNDATSICSRVRGDIGKLYSSLSKGIHHELVVPLSSTFDRGTVVEYIGDVLYNVASLGLIAHGIKHSYNNSDILIIIEAYDRLQLLEVQ